MKLRYPTGVPEFDTVAGSWFPFGVGIDCHKEMVWVCVLQPDYQQNSQSRAVGKFLTTPMDLGKMRDWLEGIVPVEHRRYLLESTSTFHFPVMLALPGWIPTVINPTLAGAGKKKTDIIHRHEVWCGRWGRPRHSRRQLQIARRDSVCPIRRATHSPGFCRRNHDFERATKLAVWGIARRNEFFARFSPGKLPVVPVTD